MSLALTPLAKSDLPRVAHIRVAPDQIRFSGTVAEAFQLDEAGIDFHAITLRALPVGFFKIDREYHARYPFASKNSLGLRAFIIDLAEQGKGLGTRACAALPAYLGQHYPKARDLFLTVNVINLPAVRAYRAAGFHDTGKIWPEGDAGPQHILQLHLAK